MPKMSEELVVAMGRNGVVENVSKEEGRKLWTLITRDGVGGLLRRMANGTYIIFCPASRAMGHWSTRKQEGNIG